MELLSPFDGSIWMRPYNNIVVSILMYKSPGLREHDQEQMKRGRWHRMKEQLVIEKGVMEKRWMSNEYWTCKEKSEWRENAEPSPIIMSQLQYKTLERKNPSIKLESSLLMYLVGPQRPRNTASRRVPVVCVS